MGLVGHSAANKPRLLRKNRIYEPSPGTPAGPGQNTDIKYTQHPEAALRVGLFPDCTRAFSTFQIMGMGAEEKNHQTELQPAKAGGDTDPLFFLTF